MNSHKRAAAPNPKGSRRGAHRRTGMLSLLASLLWLLFPVGDADAEAKDKSEAEWAFQKKENGIVVHTRPVAGSGIQEFRGVGTVDQSATKIHALLTNPDDFHTWFPDCPESKRLRGKSGETRQYSVMSTPWPIADRDNVFRSVASTDDETGTITIQVTADPTFYPEQTGRVRVQRAQGSWILEPLSANETRVTFRMHLEPGGGIPEWMINARVVGTPIDALTRMRKKLQD